MSKCELLAREESKKFGAMPQVHHVEIRQRRDAVARGAEGALWLVGVAINRCTAGKPRGTPLPMTGSLSSVHPL